jgi:hypothetical protein
MFTTKAAQGTKEFGSILCFELYFVGVLQLALSFGSGCVQSMGLALKEY